MLTKIELICGSLLVIYGLNSAWWLVHCFIYNRGRKKEQLLADREEIKDMEDFRSKEIMGIVRKVEKINRGHRSEVLRRKRGRVGVKQ